MPRKPKGRPRPGHKASLEELQWQCDGWNEAHAIGTVVKARRDSGDTIVTQTTGEALVLGGHTAVVMLKAFRGLYRLDRVEAIGKAEPGAEGDDVQW